MKKFKTDFSRYTRFEDSNYPRLITPKRANDFNNGKRPLPITVLEEANKKNLSSTIDEKEKYFVHWFRSDLRVHDNTALYHLVEEAKRIKAHPIGLYIISEHDWRTHLESPFKIEFILKSLEVLKKSLLNLNIPLCIVHTADKINVKWFEKLVKERLQSSTVFFNIQYEFDELKRDISILNSKELNCRAFHDQCAVKPGTLTTGKGSQYAKFTPWFNKWQKEKFNVLEITHKFSKSSIPDVKSDNYKDMLSSEFLLGNNKRLEYTEPEEALNNWIPKANGYKQNKDNPADDHASSRLSSHLAVGTLSSRYVISKCKEFEFVREVAFRDFYKHVLANWPYLAMYLPFNFAATTIKWSDDISLFEKWCMGQTGFPFVDATMRQLLETGYINNRCRMVVASFLAKDLGQDWRMGEKWFHHHLVDADLSSNNAGWGWASSTGIDAQPWFRIFNVYTQSSKFDPDGIFIKKWVPELKDIDASELHGPLDVEGYPTPIVDRAEAREEALDRYREALT